jgi:two-component system NarL family sensor kinase
MQSTTFTFQVIVLSTLLVVVVATAVLLLFRLILKQRKKHLLEKQEAELQFWNELNQTKVDVKNETLKQVAFDLHDNIGQLLALTRIHVKKIQKKQEQTEEWKEINTLTEKMMQEIRGLTTALQTQTNSEFDLMQSLVLQKSAIERTGKIDMVVQVVGQSTKRLSAAHSIMVYRMAQEFISNTLKYAEATEIRIVLHYFPNHLEITFRDNGKGFNPETVERGNGLNHIINRSKMMDADLKFTSTQEEGTTLVLQCKYQPYEDK